MGDKARRRRDFLAKHPLCCFCGGTTPATTIDHVPSRQLFDGRAWPEGYEFPACDDCNQSTRQEEQLIAMLSRSYPEEDTEQVQREFADALQGLVNNFPDVLQELRPSAPYVRTFLRSRGIEVPPGLTTADFPLLTTDGPLVTRCVTAFGVKLFSALHYKHNARVIPATGGIAIRLYTNINALDGAIPAELSAFLGDLPTLRRCSTSLDKQFAYRFRSTDGSSMYFVSFRQAFAMVGLVHEDASLFPSLEGVIVHPPGHVV